MTPLFRITLPLPDRKLSPNARTHYMAKASAVKKARTLAQLTVMALEKAHSAVTPSFYSVEWHYKGTKPDADNCLASCKAYLDGICQQLKINDKDLDIYLIKRIHNKTNPHLEITFY